MNRRPNIIVCLCDQLRAFEVGCYGNGVIRTPNIDRLAAQGVRFQTAITNNPVCMPARSALLTGQYSRTCQGFLGNYSVVDGATGRRTMPEHPEARRDWLRDPTLAEVCRDAGYDTALIGKWHIQPAPRLVGFDHALYPYVHHRNTGQTYIQTDGTERVVDGFAPDFEADRVEDFLRARACQDRPFFLFYNISPPHMPMADAPAKYLTMYDPADVPLRPNVYSTDRPPHNEDHWLRVYLWDFLHYDHRLPHTLEPLRGFGLRELTALYYGLTTWTDDCLGRMLGALENTGLDRSTLVVFTSDHGDHLGSHGRFNKGDLLEECLRIPMVFRDPRLPSGQTHSSPLAQTIDVMPTLLDLAALPIPASVQGRSLARAIRDPRAQPADDFVFLETPRRQIGVRTATHLFGLKMEDNSTAIAAEGERFYDLSADPYQRRNLAAGGEQAGLARELRHRLLDWHGSTPWMS